jgi:ADP-ribose 1''-phosphate phosphatase
MKSSHAPRSKRPQEKEPDDLQITESTDDIFAAPPNTLLIHACNCDGSWGAGIAAAFKARYPKAYEVHADYCDEYGTALIESAQLIPPVDAFEAEITATATAEDEDEVTPDDALQFNIPSTTKHNNPSTQNNVPAKHFIGCLFTSRHYGRRRDSPSRILSATAPAMVDLLRKVREWNAECEAGEEIREVRMCKINSGLFAVPWAKTRRVLEEIDVARSEVKVVRVISPPGS